MNPLSLEFERQKALDTVTDTAGTELMKYLAWDNDLGRAKAFLTREEDNIRWCPSYGLWYIWDKDRWVVDNRGRLETKITEMAQEAKRIVEDLVKGTASRVVFSETAEGGGEDSLGGGGGRKKKTGPEVEAERVKKKLQAMQRWVTKLGDSSTINNMVAVLKYEQSVVVEADDLDSDPWLAGVQNGILNLRTGEFYPAERTLLVTKRLGCEYDPQATCPRWESFLSEIMLGDSEMVSYLQQALGYTLTGLMSEQVFWFLYGTGSNGKSKFMETIQALGGDYLLKSPETLLARDAKGREPSRDVALLPGVRMLLGNETNQDIKLNTNIVKAITGGDTMSGTPLYEKSFQFKPMAKLWMYGNHKPVIMEQDEGTWRRVMLVPFEYEVPEDKKITDLELKLQKEMPGILNWMLRGLHAWIANGQRLKHPRRITDMNQEYRQDEDLLGAFIKERIVEKPGSRVAKSHVFQAYLHWCESENIRFQDTSVKLSRHLRNRKHPKWEMDEHNRYWLDKELAPGFPLPAGPS